MAKFFRVVFAAAIAVGISFVSYGLEYTLIPYSSAMVATGTSEYDSGRGFKHAIDGSGLSDLGGGVLGHTDSYQGNMWMTKSVELSADAPKFFCVDLGEEYVLGRIKVWNYNQSGQQTRGLKDVKIYVTNDPGAAKSSVADIRAWGDAVWSGQFTKATGNNDTGMEPITIDRPYARFVAFVFTSSYGDTKYQGLSEVQFFSTTPKGAPNLASTDVSPDGDTLVAMATLDAEAYAANIAALVTTAPDSTVLRIPFTEVAEPNVPAFQALTGLADDTTYAVAFEASNSAATLTNDANTVYAYSGVPRMVKVRDGEERGCVPAEVTVSRVSASPYPLSINYTLASDDGEAGVDYKAPDGPVVIPANETSATIRVVPIVNTGKSSDVHVTVSLANGPYFSASSEPVAVTIANASVPTDRNVWVADADSDGLASTAANWSQGVPKSTDDILVDGLFSIHDMTWDAGVNGLSDTVASWTQEENYAGTVTFLTQYPVTADPFQCFTVTGALVINGGTWTHPLSVNLDNNGTIKITDIADFRARYTYRLNVSAGTLSIGANGKINAAGRGHRQRKITSNVQQIYPSHGGRFESTTIGCYGNPKYPEDIGYASNAAGTDSAGKHAAGGGAVKLSVSGACVINGEIGVDGEVGTGNISAGAAGSILIEAPSVTGTGVIHADGIYSTNNSNIGGAGGRVALLTTTPVDTTSLTVRAGGDGAGKYSPSGTVYLKDSTSTYGTLYLNNPLHLSSSNYRNRGVFVTNEEGVDWTFDKIRMYGDIQLVIPTGTTLNLPNGFSSIVSENTAGRYSTIYYRGGNFQIGAADTQVMSGMWNFTPVSNFVFNANLVVKGGANVGFCGYFDQDVFSNGDPTTADRLFCEVKGDMDIQSDGLMSGYCAGPMAQGGSRLGYSAGNHGGRYGSATAGNIGSVFNPMSTGVGQSNSYGHQKPGAAMKLVVTGTLNVDGTISSDSYTGQDGIPYAGCPGSVNITAGKMTGSGAISAKNSKQASGGRIAVRLTESSSTFDDFHGTIKAFGGGGSDKKPISAGTVYLQTGSEPEKGGTIIINNNGNTSQLYTPVMATANIQSDKYVTDEIADFKKASLVVENSALASVEIADANGVFNMKAVTVAEGSKLDLFGNTLTVKSAKLGDTTLAVGTYAAGAAALGDFVTDSVGGGLLVVESAAKRGLTILFR